MAYDKALILCHCTDRNEADHYECTIRKAKRKAKRKAACQMSPKRLQSGMIIRFTHTGLKRFYESGSKA
ncbi:MAG: hypothetical protein Q9M29_07840, partial [Mariprofundaceae bacterium]|nr:hypothetical protein [Mariprofundaceae bacterium]